MEPMVRVRARVPGVVSAAVETVGPLGRRAVVARIDPKHRHGALAEADSETLAAAARLALDARFPLVGLIASSGTDVDGGVGALGQTTLRLTVSADDRERPSPNGP